MKKPGNSVAGFLRVKKPFSNHEIIVLAVYLLGGDSRYVDTEDIAVKANELAPGRFTWRKYPKQIDIHTVKTHLWDSKSARKGALVLGSDRAGWMLSRAGLELARKRMPDLKGVDLSRKRLTSGEEQWMRTERTRMLDSEAFRKLESNAAEAITLEEAEAFFRLNEYVIGKARERKVVRILTAFGDDPTLGCAIKLLAAKLQDR